MFNIYSLRTNGISKCSRKPKRIHMMHSADLSIPCISSSFTTLLPSISITTTSGLLLRRPKKQIKKRRRFRKARQKRHTQQKNHDYSHFDGCFWNEQITPVVYVLYRRRFLSHLHEKITTTSQSKPTLKELVVSTRGFTLLWYVVCTVYRKLTPTFLPTSNGESNLNIVLNNDITKTNLDDKNYIVSCKIWVKDSLSFCATVKLIITFIYFFSAASCLGRFISYAPDKEIIHVNANNVLIFILTCGIQIRHIINDKTIGSDAIYL